MVVSNTYWYNVLGFVISLHFLDFIFCEEGKADMFDDLADGLEDWEALHSLQIKAGEINKTLWLVFSKGF